MNNQENRSNKVGTIANWIALAAVIVSVTFGITQCSSNQDELELKQRKIDVLTQQLVEKQKLAEIEREKQHQIDSCKSSAKGRFEVARLSDLLLREVERGSQPVNGNPNADPYCRNSSLITSAWLEQGYGRKYWIENTDLDGSKVICTCSYR